MISSYNCNKRQDILHDHFRDNGIFLYNVCILTGMFNLIIINIGYTI